MSHYKKEPPKLSIKEEFGNYCYCIDENWGVEDYLALALEQVDMFEKHKDFLDLLNMNYRLKILKEFILLAWDKSK
jgi:hypothetical protein